MHIPKPTASDAISPRKKAAMGLTEQHPIAIEPKKTPSTFKKNATARNSGNYQ